MTMTETEAPAGRRRIMSAPPARYIGRISIGSLVVAVAVFAFLAYHRRWIADDGLIAVRTVRQVLAGHGPVYSPFERTETNTSTLWTFLLVIVGGIVGGDIARTAVWLGLLLAIAGLSVALYSTRRFHLRMADVGGSKLVIPVGFVVLLAIGPYWDFATSGLETGLETLWIAGIWWSLTTVGRDSGPRKLALTAFLLGLGPLVRPDLGLVTVVFAAGTWLIVRPDWRRSLRLAGVAAALPLAFEVFRAGYYATLVPMPALTKSASSSKWLHGLQYFEWFVGGYILWLPLLALAMLVGVLLGRHPSPEDRIRIVTPIIAGSLVAVYVVRVGGDFMMARTCLPAVLLMLLPVLALPLTRSLVPFTAVVAAWSLLCVVTTHHAPYQVGASGLFLADERADYQAFTGSHNPDNTAVYVAQQADMIAAMKQSDQDGKTLILLDDSGTAPLAKGFPFRHAVVAGRLGSVGAAIPLDDLVVDFLGLANPVGARITPTNPGAAGHEKPLPNAWILAAYGDPAVVDHTQVVDDTTPDQVRAARHAMSCGPVKRMLDDAQKPMSFSRFFTNIGDSFANTTLVIPSDPVAAEKEFCGGP